MAGSTRMTKLYSIGRVSGVSACHASFSMDAQREEV